MEKPTKNGDIPNRSTIKPVTYDFGAFPSSSEPVYIPETPIPSPLGPNIHPDQLLDLKASLHETQGTSKGKEIWKSWKRAWDIWNNYYIEGRVNQGWVKLELERREKDFENWKRKNKVTRPSIPRTAMATQRVPKVYTTFAGDNPPKLEPGWKWVNAGNITKEVATRQKIKTKTGRKAKIKCIVRKLRVRPGGVITYKKGSRRPRMRKVMVGRVGKWEKTGIYQYVNEDITEPGYEVEVHSTEKYVEMEDEREEAVTEMRTVSKWELVDDFDNPAHPQATNTSQVSSLSSNSNQILDIKTSPPRSSHIMAKLPKKDEEEYAWPSRTEDADGYSGGFLPLKNYVECELTGFDDPVNNAIWISRCVGEKAVDITLDRDMESFLSDSDLEVDGGADCRHSPYPVLRWAINYIRTEDGLFKKSKGWDGVTGTIFNIPTGLLDSKIFQNGAKVAEPKIFPLDIRRADLIPAQFCRPISLPSEEILDFGWDEPAKRRVIKHGDPWWTTPDQEKKRLISTHQGMAWKPQYEGNTLFPYDEANWLENRLKDDVGDAKYFVINNHGGTLIINGQEVKKGRIAGPLPKFAVIECLGHQVAFWWGVGGRTWGQTSNEPASPQDWEAIRILLPGWENIAKTAGEVWDAKFMDRMKRVVAGEGSQHDDEQWEAWRNYQPPAAQNVTSTVSNTTVSFNTEEEELEWVTAQSELIRTAAKASGNKGVLEPGGNNLWPGPNPQAPKPQPKKLTQDERKALWAQKSEALIPQQIQLVRELGIPHGVQKRVVLRERKRRRGDDVDNPNPKKGENPRYHSSNF